MLSDTQTAIGMTANALSSAVLLQCNQLYEQLEEYLSA